MQFFCKLRIKNFMLTNKMRGKNFNEGSLRQKIYLVKQTGKISKASANCLWEICICLCVKMRFLYLRLLNKAVPFHSKHLTSSSQFTELPYKDYLKSRMNETTSPVLASVFLRNIENQKKILWKFYLFNFRNRTVSRNYTKQFKICIKNFQLFSNL